MVIFSTKQFAMALIFVRISSRSSQTLLFSISFEKRKFPQCLNSIVLMTKCILREFELLGSSVLGEDTLKEAKKIVKESCKHPGGILDPD